MTKLELFQALVQVKDLARRVGTFQKDNLGKAGLAIDTKSTGIDLVTEIDKKSEEIIVNFINTNYPDHGILAEETGASRSDADYRWVVDPLDGTTNYAQGLPIFAVSIALQHKQETILGVVYCPVTDQLFSAVKGQGAFLNGERLQVSSKTGLSECVLATGFPYDIAENPANNIAYFSQIVLKARAVRRMGAAAYDLALVAAGRFDGYWELNISLWDAAAGILLIEEAGGLVVPFRNDRGLSIIAGNAAVCDLIKQEIQKVEVD